MFEIPATWVATPQMPREAPMSHRTRLLVCTATGLIAGSCVGASGVGWEFSTLSGWLTTATVFLIWTWTSIAGLDAAATAQHSAHEDETRTETGILLLSASSMSLIGVGFGLLKASTLTGSKEFFLTVVCVLSIALAWIVVQTVFTLRYAHQYCSEKGGIEFGKADPTYADFAYVSFTVGMTYQVSDTTITSRIIRSTVTRQALLSYVFGTTIIAVTISVVAGLVKK